MQLFWALIALLFASAATLAMPIAVGLLVDHGFSTNGTDLISRYFLLMLVLVALIAMASAARYYYVTWLGERIVADMRLKIFSHLLGLSPGFYAQQRSGEILSRLMSDTNQIKNTFSVSSSILLRNILSFMGAVMMMIATSPSLSGLVLLAIPLIVLPLVFYGRQVRGLSRLAQAALAEVSAFSQERLSAISLIQSFGQESTSFHYFQKRTDGAFHAAIKRVKARSFLTAAIIFTSLGSVLIVLWYGARGVADGHISGGTLAQFVLYAVFAASALGQLSEVWGDVQLAAGAASRITDILDQKSDIATPAHPAHLTQPVRGALAFNNVSFSYPTRLDRGALHNIDFAIKPGEKIALVGASGAGKTTIFTLLERFYDPRHGSITLDGLDIKSLNLSQLRSSFGLVSQETIIFSGTIFDNIHFGKPSASSGEVLNAAKAARIDEFTLNLTAKYDTQVGERGVMLSGGQRQRIAIARAILRDAPILLLDEATSALDAENEAFIQEALDKLTRERTSLVIAHRLATVRNADRIFLLEEGRLIGQGRHEALIKNNSLYARLMQSQFDPL